MRQVYMAQGFLELGDPVEAWRLLKALGHKEFYTHRVVQTTKIQILMAEKKWPEAQKLAKGSCKTMSKFASNWYTLAVIHAMQDQPAEARAALNHAIELDPKKRKEALEDLRLQGICL